MVENKSRGRGRPRKFDENDVLDRAIAVFWKKGFDGTSLDDLAEAMGIGRPSMYGAFGDKETIFMRCLERYAGTVCSPALCAMDDVPTIREAIFTYLHGVAEYTTSNDSPAGCMLGAVACVHEDSNAREFATIQVGHAERKITARLNRAIETGELPSDFPVARSARRVINAMLAISVRARYGATREELIEDAEDAATLSVTFDARNASCAHRERSG